MARFDSALDVYTTEADELLTGLGKSDDVSEWRFKWMHPRFRGQPVHKVREAKLALDDARLVVAHDYAFESWPDLERYVTAVQVEGQVRAFEAAVEWVVSGDTTSLSAALRDDPNLPVRRSVRRHHATLLHYLGANGVEGVRQRTPVNAVAVATLLLDAGAEVDALADLYEERCTTLSMLVSSSPPAEAGLQTELALLLVDRGAKLIGPGSNWQSAVLTALKFGFFSTARALALRILSMNSVIEAAGLGSTDDVRRLLPSASVADRQAALSLAAQHGHADVTRLLLLSGADPNQYNPDGYHSHSTPLHEAVWNNHLEIVELLVESGASLDIRDTIYEGTPLGWAEYGKRPEIAAYLRGRT